MPISQLHLKARPQRTNLHQTLLEVLRRCRACLSLHMQLARKVERVYHRLPGYTYVLVYHPQERFKVLWRLRRPENDPFADN